MSGKGVQLLLREVADTERLVQVGADEQLVRVLEEEVRHLALVVLHRLDDRRVPLLVVQEPDRAILGTEDHQLLPHGLEVLRIRNTRLTVISSTFIPWTECSW